MNTFESVSFEASLLKANALLRIIGMQIDDEESNQTLFRRLGNRKLYIFLTAILYSEVLGEVAWFAEQGVIGNFVQVTYTVPCATLCFLGTAKMYYRMKYGHHINDLIYSLRKLQSIQFDCQIHTNSTAYEAIRNMVGKLFLAIKMLTIINLSALSAFLLGPLVVIVFVYFTTGILELRYPFLILYPFDTMDLRIFPFVYFHQMIGGVVAVYSVLGPDCLYYIFCTFVQVQFSSLQYDFERIIAPSTSSRLQKMDDAYRKKLRGCFVRHRELIRCCELIETVYCKSALFNFMSSSLLLCLTGFNILVYEDLVMFSNFLSFLFMCLMQIYLICDYGHKVSQASTALSNAIYSSQWYNVDANTAKDLFVIMTRAQKPCILTAYRFAQMNLAAFTRILSTSWSYFALLQSVYNRKK